MPRFTRIVILTGAGISAESGLATFRDKDGIWSKVDYRTVATPEGFARNPGLVHDFYNVRRRDHAKVKPNGAHIALARLESEFPGEVVLVTQNIDALHEAAGSCNVIHMHGELLKAWCLRCDNRYPWCDDIETTTNCPACGKTGGVRPDVVWFGEIPYHMEQIAVEMSRADLFISIGTSGSVYPAAGFVADARESGAHTVELNLEPSEGVSSFHETYYGPATEVVPEYVGKLLRQG
jgi:NAD-dependent deacetylase